MFLYVTIYSLHLDTLSDTLGSKMSFLMYGFDREFCSVDTCVSEDFRIEVLQLVLSGHDGHAIFIKVRYYYYKFLNGSSSSMLIKNLFSQNLRVACPQGKRSRILICFFFEGHASVSGQSSH